METAEKETVVLIHGYGSDASEAWKVTGWTQMLEDAGYRVIAPTLRGHANSGNTSDPLEYSVPSLAADVIREIGDPPEGGVHLVVHSMGGLIALELVRGAPGLVRSVAFLACDASNHLAPFADLDPSRDVSDEQLLAADAGAGALTVAAVKAPGRDRAALIACAVGVGRHRLVPVHVPRSIVINGENDRIVSDGGQLAASVGAELVRIGGARHTQILRSSRAQELVLGHLRSSARPSTSAVDQFRAAVTRFPQRVAVVFEDTELSYQQLYERSCRFAGALRDIGVAPGERVATLASNRLESVEEIVGIALAGCVRVPLYAYNSAKVHLHMLQTTGARLLVVDADIWRGIRDDLSGIPDMQVLVHGDAEGGALEYGRVVEAASADAPRVAWSPDAPFIVRFSSGTTGLPKAIMHTERSCRRGGEALASVLGVDGETVQIVAGPISHISGALIWPMLAAAGTQIIMPRFDPAAFVTHVESGGNLSLLVPTMIQDIIGIDGITPARLRKLRAIGYGGAPISEPLLRRAIAQFPPVFIQLYGQSEVMPISASGVAAHDIHSPEFDPVRLRSAGAPVPGARVRIVDDGGVDVPSGEIGEIAVQAPWLTDGIWGNDAALADRTLSDGSFLTRDVGYLRAGLLYVSDRKDDLIISGGFNIWPKEVEDALIAHADVTAAAVVGVPHPRWGETPIGVVTLAPGSDVTAADLIEWCRERVGGVKKPTAVVIRTTPFPSNGTGKVVRSELRREYLNLVGGSWEGRSDDVQRA